MQTQNIRFVFFHICQDATIEAPCVIFHMCLNVEIHVGTPTFRPNAKCMLHLPERDNPPPLHNFPNVGPFVRTRQLTFDAAFPTFVRTLQLRPRADLFDICVKVRTHVKYWFSTFVRTRKLKSDANVSAAVRRPQFRSLPKFPYLSERDHANRVLHFPYLPERVQFCQM